MTQRLKLLYPFLFSIVPILSIVIRNPGQASPSDIGVVIGFMLVACGLLYLFAALAAGFRWSSPVVPLLVLVVIAWFYEYDALTQLARRIAGDGPERAVLLIMAAATVVVAWWLARRPRILDRASTFLTLTGTILVVWFGARFVADQVRARLGVRNSMLAKELARPITMKPFATEASAGPLRDIYLIILDEYANSRILRDQFGFDNRVFEDSLRALGFTIPQEVRSNYIHTSLSLPSLLNFGHMTKLTGEVGARSTDPTLPNYLLENNRTVTFLKARGYKFFFFPSQWWISTQHNRNADWEFKAWSGFDLGREATRSDLRRSFVGSTVLHLLKNDHANDADHVKRTLAGLEQVPARPEPTFAFAHILSPHRPYAFNSDCQTPKQRVVGGSWVASKREAYIQQVQCLNHLVLGVVTTLLRRSAVPPIILLQGDHGTPTLGYFNARSASTVSPAQARERFGAFGAYYLPGGGDKLFADSVTLVNVFQKVLSYYFGANVPPTPDHLYLSMDRTPYSFVEVDPASLATSVSADGNPTSRLEHDVK